MVSDGDDHRRRRRLVQPAFSIKRVDAHLGLVVAEVDRALAAWQPGAQLDAAASLRDAVRRIVVRALFGEELGAEADRFGELLEPGLRYVQRMPQLRFEHDLRVNPYARVQRSNRAADELVLGRGRPPPRPPASTRTPTPTRSPRCWPASTARPSPTPSCSTRCAA